MKLNRLILSMMFMTSSLANAGIYSCESSNSKPKEILNEQLGSLVLSKTSPIFPDSATTSINSFKNKSPFLVYYAVDSSEAFMKYAVGFEVASLQAACKKNINVNFVAFTNSLYTKKNQFVVCKNQNLSTINLSKYPELDKSLKQKRKFLANNRHEVSLDNDDDLGPMSYRNSYDEKSNKAYAKYPLAHPDFLFDLVNLVTTEKDLFPSEQYVPFFNLKSHGGELNVLAGMHKCQERAKEIAAEKFIEKILTKDEIKFLNKQDTFDKIEANLNKYGKIVGKIGLSNIGSLGGDIGMGGDVGMSIFTSGLGNIINGLGVDHGLGGEFAFGTGQANLNWVLQDLFASGSDKALGFLMLESCDTNRDADLFHSYLDNIYGYYSAQHSLWYRNLNWWEMLEKAEGNAVKLIEIVKENTAKIPNIYFK